MLLLAAPMPAHRSTLRADRVVICKSRRELSLVRAGRVIRTYEVALGADPIGQKRCEGDNRTPEGLYRIDSRNASSRFHRSLHVSYPNAADTARARAAGCRPGGDIMIHGITNGLGWIGAAHRSKDWTAGASP